MFVLHRAGRFLPTMQTLLKRADSLDGIVVETSGLALPRPLLQALEWPGSACPGGGEWCDHRGGW